jgi:hypothetical protein
MNNSLKVPLTLCVLLSACIVILLHADSKWFHDQFFNWPKESPSQEDLQSFKAWRKKLDQITYDLKEDDQGVTITFNGFETLKENDVEIIEAHGIHGWIGTIKINEGEIDFVLNHGNIHVRRILELKKEGKENGRIIGRFFTIGITYFFSWITTSTLKAEVKNNTLILTAQKPQEEVLLIG